MSTVRATRTSNITSSKNNKMVEIVENDNENEEMIAGDLVPSISFDDDYSYYLKNIVKKVTSTKRIEDCGELLNIPQMSGINAQVLEFSKCFNPYINLNVIPWNNEDQKSSMRRPYDFVVKKGQKTSNKPPTNFINLIDANTKKPYMSWKEKVAPTFAWNLNNVHYRIRMKKKNSRNDGEKDESVQVKEIDDNDDDTVSNILLYVPKEYCKDLFAIDEKLREAHKAIYNKDGEIEINTAINFYYDDNDDDDAEEAESKDDDANEEEEEGGDDDDQHVEVNNHNRTFSHATIRAKLKNTNYFTNNTAPSTATKKDQLSFFIHPTEKEDNKGFETINYMNKNYTHPMHLYLDQAQNSGQVTCFLYPNLSNMVNGTVFVRWTVKILHVLTDLPSQRFMNPDFTALKYDNSLLIHAAESMKVVSERENKFVNKLNGIVDDDIDINDTNNGFFPFDVNNLSIMKMKAFNNCDMAPVLYNYGNRLNPLGLEKTFMMRLPYLSSKGIKKTSEKGVVPAKYAVRLYFYKEMEPILYENLKKLQDWVKKEAQDQYEVELSAEKQKQKQLKGKGNKSKAAASTLKPPTVNDIFRETPISRKDKSGNDVERTLINFKLNIAFDEDRGAIKIPVFNVTSGENLCDQSGNMNIHDDDFDFNTNLMRFEGTDEEIDDFKQTHLPVKKEEEESKDNDGASVAPTTITTRVKTYGQDGKETLPSYPIKFMIAGAASVTYYKTNASCVGLKLNAKRLDVMPQENYWKELKELRAQQMEMTEEERREHEESENYTNSIFGSLNNSSAAVKRIFVNDMGDVLVDNSISDIIDSGDDAGDNEEDKIPATINEEEYE